MGAKYFGLELGSIDDNAPHHNAFLAASMHAERTASRASSCDWRNILHSCGLLTPDQSGEFHAR
jgi:hypothetical protein